MYHRADSYGLRVSLAKIGRKSARTGMANTAVLMLSFRFYVSLCLYTCNFPNNDKIKGDILGARAFSPV